MIALFKGPVYRDTHERVWQSLLTHRARVDEHVAVLGLDAYVDESEGYAFLRTQTHDQDDDPLPRLVPRRKLSFALSLLLVLLRRRLLEHDTDGGGDTKVVLTRDQIVATISVFLPENSNEARLLDQIDSQITKAVNLGFLRPVKGGEPSYEVRRILAAFVDGQWLGEFDARLAEYADRVREHQ